MAQANRRTINGVPSWQAVRVFTVKRPVQDEATGAVIGFERIKKRLTGTAPTKALAEQRLEEKVMDFRALMVADPYNDNLVPQRYQQSITVSELYDKWLVHRQEASNKDKLDQATVGEYNTRFRVHIEPNLGTKRISALTKKMLNTFIWTTLVTEKKTWVDENGEIVKTDEPRNGLSLRRTIYSLLNQMLEYAVFDDLLTHNPLLGVTRPKAAKMSDAAEAAIIEHHYIPAQIYKSLYDTAELGMWILSFMGLRASERLGVENSSFRHLEDSSRPTELIINRQLDRDRKTGKFFIKNKTKTRSGKRIITLPDEVTHHLLLWKKQREKWEKEGKKKGTWKPDEGLENLFFVKEDGTAIRPQKDRYAWTRLLTRLNLPHHRGHDMRHMTATALGTARVSPTIARVILGHSTTLMTFYYQHFNAADTADALKEVAAMFSADAPTLRVEADADDADMFEVVGSSNALTKLLLMGQDPNGNEIDMTASERAVADMKAIINSTGREPKTRAETDLAAIKKAQAEKEKTPVA